MILLSNVQGYSYDASVHTENPISLELQNLLRLWNSTCFEWWVAFLLILALVVEQTMVSSGYQFDWNDTADDDWEYEPEIAVHERRASSDQITSSLRNVDAREQPVSVLATDDWCLCGECDTTNASLPYRARIFLPQQRKY